MYFNLFFFKYYFFRFNQYQFKKLQTKTLLKNISLSFYVIEGQKSNVIVEKNHDQIKHLKYTLKRLL